MKNIAVVAFDHCMVNPAITTFELFGRINEMVGESFFNARLVACSAGKEVVTTDGLTVPCHCALAETVAADLIILPAFEGDVLEQLETNGMVIPWLRKMYALGADMAAICTGAFALAEAGLLDGRSATTHWAHQDLFKARYPRVNMKPHQIVVDEGRVITSGGAFSFLNLILYLVEKFLGYDAAVNVSRYFLIDLNKSPQGSYAIFSEQKNHTDDLILKVQASIEEDLCGNFTIRELAERASLSNRQFSRRFKNATGNTPLEYVQRLRVESAKRALISTGQSFEKIAWNVGYSDIPGFRKLFIRYTGLPPSEFRRKYSINHDTVYGLAKQQQA